MSTIQRITSPYQVASNFTAQDLPRNSEPYLEIASINQFGILLSAGIRLNNRNVIIRCEIDDELVFEVDINNIYEMLSQNDTPTNTNVVFGFEDSKDLFTFKPSAPLMFRNNIKFYAKANSNSGSRDFIGALIEYTRE